MKQQPVSRRSFLEVVSIAGIATMYSANLSKVSGSEKMPLVNKKIFVCSVCGHIEFGEAPDECPVCHASKENFTQNDALFTDVEKEFASAGDKHLPVITATKKSTMVTEQPSISVGIRIGSVIHPMVKEHHIRFIDCYIDDMYVSRLTLTLNNHPAAGIEIRKPGSKVRIVTLCNLHGHWQNVVTVV